MTQSGKNGAKVEQKTSKKRSKIRAEKEQIFSDFFFFVKMEEDWTQRGKNGAKEDQNEQNWQKEQKRSKIRAEREQVLRELFS